jgi:hypothetical protein
MTDHWSDDPDWVAYERRVRDELLPKLEGSALTISLVPRGPTDVKFAVELGLSIMLDKPIIAVVVPGAHMSERLARVADAIIEADLDDPDTRENLATFIAETLRESES